MTDHRGLVLTLPMAAAARTTGASLRVDDVVAALEDGGHAADVVQAVPKQGNWCTAVAVSYANAGAVSALGERAQRVWLDAMDSWTVVNWSGVRAGHVSYAARAVRDGVRIALLPTPDLVTWICDADRRADRWTVRGRDRMVLPGRLIAPSLGPAVSPPRAVVAGDWGYPPNADGLRWLVKQVLPRTGATIDVFGSGAPVLRSPQVRVHGYVTDAGALYRQGDVHVCPVRWGGGVKRKVLLPLLAGLPVVTTTAGAHGLQAHPLLDEREDPARFAAALDERLAGAAQHVASPVRDPSALVDADEHTEVVRWISSCAR